MTAHRRSMAILCLALSLRLLRGLCRWDEWALHYAAYYSPVRLAAQAGDWVEAATTWTGLHPPLYGMIHTLLNEWFGSPAAWLGFSVCVSLLAVLALLQTKGPLAWLAAVVLATDPVQLHYAAEVNNYPLLVCMIGVGWWARSHERWVLLGIIGIAAAWTHMLAAVTVGAIALFSARPWHSLTIMAAGTLPLGAGAMELFTDMGHRSQPPLDLGASTIDAIDRFTPSFLLLLPIGILGVRHQLGAAGTWLTALTCWIAMVALGLAAPHQFPYALALGVPAAALVAAGATGRHPNVIRGVVCICLLRGLWSAGSDVERLWGIYSDADASKAIDAVMAHARPDDAIVLVRGLEEQDDDKRHTSAVLWQFPPWQTMEDANTPATSQAPHLFGNPRQWQGRTLYTYDQPRPSMTKIEATRVFTVVYGAAAHSGQIPLHPRQTGRRMFGRIEVLWPIADREATGHD